MAFGNPVPYLRSGMIIKLTAPQTDRLGLFSHPGSCHYGEHSHPESVRCRLQDFNLECLESLQCYVLDHHEGNYSDKGHGDEFEIICNGARGWVVLEHFEHWGIEVLSDE